MQDARGVREDSGGTIREGKWTGNLKCPDIIFLM